MRPLTAPEILAFSQGRVTNPEAFNYRTGRPVPGGLYSEEVFGSVPAFGFQMENESRGDRWGHMELAEPVALPALPHERIALWPVLPPAFRRFRKRSPEESRADARAFRAEVLATDERTLGDPPEKVLAEAGLLHEEDIETLGETWAEHPLDTCYRGVVNVSARLRRLFELNAPDQVIANSRTLLASKVAALDEELGRHTGSLPEAVFLRARGLVA